jgi:hypothetical protein
MRWIALPATVTLAAALLGGCAGAVRTELPAPDHPANPAAAEAPPPSPTMTLAHRSPMTGGPEVEGVVPPQVGKPGGSDHSGHPGHAAPVGTTYICPMHPKVTSTDPSARCPECNMKINKPAKAATAPAARPAPGHSHDHGGANQ